VLDRREADPAERVAVRVARERQPTTGSAGSTGGATPSTSQRWIASNAAFTA
jgi:hypothetical protein